MTNTTIIDLRHYSPLVDASCAVDESIQLPVEICLHHRSGQAFASYEGAQDERYRNLDCLLDAHTMDADHMVSWLASEDRDGDAQAVAVATAEETDQQFVDRVIEEIRQRVDPAECLAQIAARVRPGVFELQAQFPLAPAPNLRVEFQDSFGQKPTYSDARFMDHLGEDDS